ncbi:hypothetical protein [Arthrobacter sp. L77]|uniref:hypothetical protein n=1 Tax=Arthrobacter sp. L77 TaxID=1496689 RepID=UPI0012E0AE1A|nr:hypothetical protein [Arthrobacter sp. L77]
MLESTGYLDLAGVEMIAHSAASGAEFVVVGLVIAVGAALTVFIITTPRRRLWAAHRAAGWTTAQCTDASRRRNSEARALGMEARLRELGLEPMKPVGETRPASVRARSGDAGSARHRAKPRWTSALHRARTGARYATLLAMVGVVLTVLFSPLLDRLDVQTVRCEVGSAEPRTSSGGSRGSASTASVLVETDCGPVVVVGGVTFDNREQVASSFEPGADDDVEIGWYSRVVMKDLLRELPTADHYRPVA